MDDHTLDKGQIYEREWQRAMSLISETVYDLIYTERSRQEIATRLAVFLDNGVITTRENDDTG